MQTNYYNTCFLNGNLKRQKSLKRCAIDSKVQKFQHIILYPTKASIITEGEIKTSLDKTKCM